MLVRSSSIGKNMKYRNVKKAMGVKHAYNILEELKKARTINESPQFIPPLNMMAIEAMKEWIMKIHTKLGENGVKFKVLTVNGLNVIMLDRVKIPHYPGRKNIVYYVNEKGVAFFSLFEIKTNLKGIKSTVTQFLVYRDQNNNELGRSSITLNDISWDVIFPISNSFLCDKQQTEFGRKSWEYIVKQSFKVRLSVYVYDSKFGELIKFSSIEDYNANIDKYYGTQKDYQRYQVLIRKE